MAQTQSYRTVKAKASILSDKNSLTNTAKAETKAETVKNQTPPRNVVVFTSFDGTVREVEDSPLGLGRATALANERTAGKIWGTSEEEAACLVMQKGI